MTELKQYSVAILTSGGDSPGMNCAIRAITRSLLYFGHKVYGVDRGYSGLVEGNFKQLQASDVGNIMQLGGTMLRTSRSKEFATPAGRQKAMNHLKSHRIDGLIVIGGDGSYKGAYALFEDFAFPVVTLPGTIDNDIKNTDYTIGHDTAVQTAMEAIDRVRDTALSHDRVFFIEVMGRNSSAIALKVGVCTGAENVLEPHQSVNYQQILDAIERGTRRGKVHSIFVVAEGHHAGRSYEIQKTLLEKYHIDSRVCILGHTQRGGSPTAMDRMIAAQMGGQAAKEMLNLFSRIELNKSFDPMAIGYQQGRICSLLLKDCLEKVPGSDNSLLELIKQLSI